MNRLEFLRYTAFGIAGCQHSLVLPKGFLLNVSSKPENLNSFPLIRLNNGVIEALVFLPDADNGYYRGSRFDWSGIIGQVTYLGHTYFRPWQHSVAREVPPDPHNPENPNDGAGTVEEFREPCGYSDAIPGGQFLKIGVGVLIKPGDLPYDFSRKYEISKPGKWKVSNEENQVKLVQKLSTDFGFAYQYTKMITLQPDEPKIIVNHKLSNQGQKQITTSTYCHNFILLDGMEAGSGYEIKFKTSVEASKLSKEYATIHDNCISLLQSIPAKGTIGAPVMVKELQNHVEVLNHFTGTSVAISGTQTLASFYVWISATAVCPEPMIEIDLKPGETSSWENCYAFRSS